MLGSNVTALLNFYVAVVAYSPIHAASAPAREIEVADKGRTHIASDTIDGRIDVVISTRTAMPQEARSGGVTRCSGGRTVCSLVDGMTITIGNIHVAVPPRATLLLSDVNRGHVLRLSSKRYELILRGGDAASSYDAHLFFDRRMVNRMDIWSSEAGALEQSTTYRDVSKAFM